jgi:hypothetical protein
VHVQYGAECMFNVGLTARPWQVAHLIFVYLSVVTRSLLLLLLLLSGGTPPQRSRPLTGHTASDRHDLYRQCTIIFWLFACIMLSCIYTIPQCCVCRDVRTN